MICINGLWYVHVFELAWIKKPELTMREMNMFFLFKWIFWLETQDAYENEISRLFTYL